MIGRQLMLYDDASMQEETVNQRERKRGDGMDGKSDGEDGTGQGEERRRWEGGKRERENGRLGAGENRGERAGQGSGRRGGRRGKNSCELAGFAWICPSGSQHPAPWLVE